VDAGPDDGRGVPSGRTLIGVAGIDAPAKGGTPILRVAAEGRKKVGTSDLFPRRLDVLAETRLKRSMNRLFWRMDSDPPRHSMNLNSPMADALGFEGDPATTVTTRDRWAWRHGWGFGHH
jgi:hypothetical protein